MRKVLLIVGLAAALAAPALVSPGAALAANGKPAPPPVICGTACDGGGGGPSGCWQSTYWQDRGVNYLDKIHHYVVVQWCRTNGTFTMFAIVQHGCDTSGFVSCRPTAAYATSGGVGWGWVSFEAHADVAVTIPKALGYNLTDVFSATIGPG